jgi:hypothetical protein
LKDRRNVNGTRRNSAGILHPACARRSAFPSRRGPTPSPS